MNQLSLTRSIFIFAFLLTLPQVLLAQELLLHIQELPGEYDTGKIIAPYGDMNSDGKDDIVVVSSVYGSTFHDVIRIYSASGGILSTRHLPNGEVLSSFVVMNDLDGDNVDDYAYGTGGSSFPGTPGSLSQLSFYNEIKVVSGATGALIRTHLRPTPTSSTWGIFGKNLANVGDLDGDGIDELATSDPEASTAGLVLNGSAYIYSGATGLLIFQKDGTANGERLGSSISEVGDLNGDGISEFAIGVLGDYNTSVSTALALDRALIISGLTGALLSTIVMPASINTASFQVFEFKGGDDVDNDGINDIVLARADDGTGGPNAGRIRSISGATGNLIGEFIGQPCQGIGTGIDVVDINGDGYADIISANMSDTTAVQNEATVISGLTHQLMVESAALATNVQNVSGAGDFNGDGFEDFMFSFISPSNLSRHVKVLAGGPALGSTANSKVGANLGQVEDVLRVDQKTGGQVHCVTCDMGATITFSIDQPSTNMAPADFVIFGRAGVPLGNETYVVPGVIGEMTLVPAPMATWAIPMVFTLATSVGPMLGGEVFQTGPAPWTYSMAGGINFPFEFTLEGVIMQDATTATKTNAVVVLVR